MTVTCQLWATSFQLVMASCRMQKLLSEQLLPMRYALLFLLSCPLLSSLPALGQILPAPLVPDNSAWLDSVQHLSLSQQVAAVQQRAWHDTLLAPYQMAVCAMGVSAAPRRTASWLEIAAPAKPRGFPLIYVVNGQAFDNRDSATISQLQQRLRTQPIRQVTRLRDGAAAAIYGTRGANGVVVLSSTKTKHRNNY
jgi:TonB-dependent SusC/RagA subfamily outer membrane receptor